MLKIICLFVFLIAVAINAFAQEEKFIDDEGEVVEGEFLINKELEISLPAAQRIFQKVSPEEVNSGTTEPLQYTFQNYTPALSDIRTRLRVLKLKDEGKVSSIKHLVITPVLHKLTLRRRLGPGQLSPIAADAAEYADS